MGARMRLLQAGSEGLDFSGCTRRDGFAALSRRSILLSDVFFSRDYRRVASRMILFSQTPTCQFPNAQHGLHMGD
ncbi:hypothetical protein PVAP13_1NG412600 [Panicum virgatum]|uniref:Uncharacterized protein n=1 Tax=Panicum virgatum TaxID=38727 RepID=A0A8T0X7S1_PANVG|nr:hypothetical protein PVAP13_1NG412600 [Panicum virgatum]